MDAERYLRNEGKDALDQKFSNCMEMLLQDPFASDKLDADHLVELNAKLKPLTTSLRSLQTNYIGLQWKIKKRQNPPADALELMQECRNKVGDAWHLCSLFLSKEKDFDTDKAASLMTSWASFGGPAARQHSCTCQAVVVSLAACLRRTIIKLVPLSTHTVCH